MEHQLACSPKLQKKPKQPPAEVTKAVDKIASFPSREASGTAQMNITGDKAVLDRSDRICKEDRRSRHTMLEILMNAFEKGQDG